MLKNHPRVLGYIFFTEMWERVGFYTLMAVLVLYMDKVLGWSDGRKGDSYGLFLALCYFVPLLGGWLGDKVIGRIRTVRAGAFLMVFGYIGLAVSGPGRVLTFYLGLFLIGLGTGIFKVNMAVLVGSLYEGRPELKDAGYNIFYMGVNLGAMIAPLLATFISVRFHSYNLSFAIAAAGMVVALIIWRAGEPRLRPYDCRPAPGAAAPGAASPASPLQPGLSPAGCPAVDRREERQRIATLATLFLIVIFFWVAFYQNFFGLTLFAERSTVVLKWLRPETYQFFEPFFILTLTPLLLALFGRLNRRGREPSTPVKILVGMAVMSLAMMLMAGASLAGGNRDQNIMSPAWLVGTYFLVTVAEILISPMGQSFVSKVAPPRIAGLMMGGWFAATAVGSYGSGLLGKSYSALAHHLYFLILAALLVLAAVLVAVFLRKLRRFAA
ncbi:MAG TPA: peptide MFS transporter [Candidatus Aminicenantes bacterium]|nr:peptide MFS transporter [Candidatus Aminicenantes bacterium]HRY64530.1 peptide MFS transporter [Candidatus Aminicenantes bacterium]HRZ71443.1 peptide MFS transporter [Candidatus Aminicenantes bacterium]